MYLIASYTKSHRTCLFLSHSSSLHFRLYKYRVGNDCIYVGRYICTVCTCTYTFKHNAIDLPHRLYVHTYSSCKRPTHHMYRLSLHQQLPLSNQRVLSFLRGRYGKIMRSKLACFKPPLSPPLLCPPSRMLHRLVTGLINWYG